MAAWDQTAVAVQVFGLCRVDVSWDGGSSYDTLGYSLSGINIIADPVTLPIFGDENGGAPDGTPIEIQTLGETHRVVCDLTKWNPTAAAKIQKRGAATLGIPDTPGTLLFAGTNKVAWVKLVCTAVHALHQPFAQRLYKRCASVSQIELTPGTKYSHLSFEFTAYKDADGRVFTDT